MWGHAGGIITGINWQQPSMLLCYNEVTEPVLWPKDLCITTQPRGLTGQWRRAKTCMYYSQLLYGSPPPWCTMLFQSGSLHLPYKPFLYTSQTELISSFLPNLYIKLLLKERIPCWWNALTFITILIFWVPRIRTDLNLFLKLTVSSIPR